MSQRLPTGKATHMTPELDFPIPQIVSVCCFFLATHLGMQRLSLEYRPLRRSTNSAPCPKVPKVNRTGRQRVLALEQHGACLSGPITMVIITNSPTVSLASLVPNAKIAYGAPPCTANEFPTCFVVEPGDSLSHLRGNQVNPTQQ